MSAAPPPSPHLPLFISYSFSVLRSRDQPDTIEKHEVALKFAEKLVRRTPPDLAHRAAELSRDLLYLEDAFDLEVSCWFFISYATVYCTGHARPVLFQKEVAGCFFVAVTAAAGRRFIIALLFPRYDLLHLLVWRG